MAFAVVALTSACEEGASPPPSPPPESLGLPSPGPAADVSTAPVLAAPKLLDQVVGAADTQLDGPSPPRLTVQHDARSGAWAFVTARLTSADGGDYPFEATTLAARARSGELEPRLSALARQDEAGAWEIVALDIGSTDLAWWVWPQRFDAPAEIFPLSVEAPAWGPP